MVKLQILFLCTGNYYRSRFAEEYFNYRVTTVAPDWIAFSRGLAPQSKMNDPSGNPGPISIYALTYLNLYRIESQDVFRYPLSVRQEDLENAAHVVALSKSEHKDMFTVLYPQLEHRVQYLEIEDIHITEPSRAIPRLVHNIDQLMSDLTANK